MKIQDILREFDKLHAEQTKGKFISGKRYVDYSGEKLDIDGYILKRIEEINQQTTTL